MVSRQAHINASIIRQMPMRSRLDVVLARLGLPSLNAMPIDERLLEAEMETEERVIHEAYGVDGYASGSQPSQPGSQGMDTLPLREPRIAKGAIVEATYARIVGAAPVTDIDFFVRLIGKHLLNGPHDTVMSSVFRGWTERIRRRPPSSRGFWKITWHFAICLPSCRIPSWKRNNGHCRTYWHGEDAKRTRSRLQLSLVF